jgi:hypothetical protein
MVTEKVHQFLCGLQGHDTLRHFDKGRISLQCVTCGYQTPGWDLRREDWVREAAEFKSPRVTLREAAISGPAQGSACRGTS